MAVEKTFFFFAHPQFPQIKEGVAPVGSPTEDPGKPGWRDEDAVTADGVGTVGFSRWIQCQTWLRTACAGCHCAGTLFVFNFPCTKGGNCSREILFIRFFIIPISFTPISAQLRFLCDVLYSLAS